jgi:dihydrofolate reductase
MKKFNVIFTTDLDGSIGLNGKLPWKFSLDYNFFKSIIQYNSILPGIIQTDNIFDPLDIKFNILLTADNPVFVELENNICKEKQINPETLRRLLSKAAEYSESGKAHGLPDDLLRILQDEL